jgi:hypothetical protein
MRTDRRGVSMVAALFIVAVMFGHMQDVFAAESEVSLVSAPYVESFVPNAKVSGNLLVGVKWLGAAGNFDPEKITIHISPQVRGRKVCVEINSQDGRYSAENLYYIGSGTTELSHFPTGTGFSRDLAKYDSDAMAVTVRLVDSCDALEVGTILPAILKVPSAIAQSQEKESSSRQLVALVNAEPQKISLRLMDRQKEVGHSMGCNAAETKVKVAFTSSCTVSLDSSLPPGQYDLELLVHERFERLVKHFPVIID